MFPHERSLVKRMEGRPFALVGVDSVDEKEKLKETVRKRELTWRSFADEDGHISTDWNVEACPTLFLIDHKGVIRRRYDGDPGAKELDRAIDRLVEEAEKDGAPAA